MKKGLSYLNIVPVVLLCLLGLFTGLSWFWDRRVDVYKRQEFPAAGQKNREMLI